MFFPGLLSIFLFFSLLIYVALPLSMANLTAYGLVLPLNLFLVFVNLSLCFLLISCYTLVLFTTWKKRFRVGSLFLFGSWFGSDSVTHLSSDCVLILTLSSSSDFFSLVFLCGCLQCFVRVPFFFHHFFHGVQSFCIVIVFCHSQCGLSCNKSNFSLHLWYSPSCTYFAVIFFWQFYLDKQTGLSFFFIWNLLLSKTYGHPLFLFFIYISLKYI